MDFLIIILFGVTTLWLLVVLPQRRRQRAQNQMLDGLKPGDEVVTAGGLYGDVTEVGDDEIAMEIAPNVEVRIAKRAIGAVIPPDAYDDEAEPDEKGPEAAPEDEPDAPERR